MPFQDFLQNIFSAPPTPQGVMNVPAPNFGPYTPPIAPTVDFGVGQIGPVPPDIFATPNPSFNPAPQDDFFGINPPRPAYDEFIRSASNPPEWQRPSLARMLGTIGYSLSRRGPNRTTETINPAGEVSRSTQWSSWNPLSFEEADQIVNMPNRRRQDEWKLKTGGLQQAASAEERRLQTESLSRQRNVNASVAQQREQRLAQTAEGRMELDRLKQQLAEWKAKNPQGRVLMPRGGNVIIVNPVTGDVTDTGIPTGLMDEREKQILIGQQGIDRLNVQGLQRDADFATRQKNALQLEEERQKNRLQLQNNNIQNRATAPQYPTQERVGVQNKISRLIAMNPTWKQWITIDENGQPVIDEPNSGTEVPFFGSRIGGNGLDEKTYWNIVAAIHGPQYVPPEMAQKFGIVGSTTPQPSGQVKLAPPPASLNKPGRKWQNNGTQWRYSDDNGKTWTVVGG